MNFKVPARVTFLLGSVLGALVVYNLMPAPTERVEYKDRIKTETKVVTKVVHVKGPDGSERTETEIVDTGSRLQDTSLLALKAAQKQFLVGVNASAAWGHFEQPEYSLILGRRIAGPLLGALNVSKERTGMALYFEF